MTTGILSLINIKTKMEGIYCSRRTFGLYFYFVIGLGTLFPLQSRNIQRADGEVTDFRERMEEFKMYMRHFIDELKDEKAKTKAAPGTKQWTRNIYEGDLKGKKVSVSIDLPFHIPSLEMIIEYSNQSPHVSKLLTWQGGRGSHRYYDKGIIGHLFHDGSSFSIFEESLMEDFFYDDEVGYIFEKLSLSKPNERCKPSELGPKYCVVAKATYDLHTEEVEKDGIYLGVRHEDLLKRVAENRVQANAEYRELLMDVIKELKKTGKILSNQQNL